MTTTLVLLTVSLMAAIAATAVLIFLDEYVDYEDSDDE